MKLNVLDCRRCLLHVAVGVLLASKFGSAADADTTAEFQITLRSKDSAVYQKVVPTTNSAGVVTAQVQQFTLIENNLHYLEDGVWKPSEDLIETSPDGAVARRGPDKANFGEELNAQVVFDIVSDTTRVGGGVRGIQLTDCSTGKSLQVGTVKDSVKGQLVPPNSIVWADAFDGIAADVVVVWKHNMFSHDVILRERPSLPADWQPANVRLEIVTELFVDAEPELQSQQIQPKNQPGLEDDTVIRFGNLAMIMGKAFSLADDNAFSLGGGDLSNDGTPVVKQWIRTADGRHFLIESLSWSDASPLMSNLPVHQANYPPPNTNNVELARLYPKTPHALSSCKPVELAAAPYVPSGCIIDFTIIPDDGTPTTLASGQTYYIKTSYYSGSAVTFQPGCVIKYKNNANMLLYGQISFPSPGQPMPVFTSRNDDLFGEKIQNVQGELPSDGDPTKHKAAKAILIYYVNFSTVVQNARIRWAQRGIEYDANPNVYTTHYVNDSLFQECTTGIYCNLQQGTLRLSNDKKCNVTTPIWTVSGMVFGSMSDDCGISDLSRMLGTQAEATVAINPSNPANMVVVSINIDQGQALHGLFEAWTANGGASWTTRIIADGSDSLPQSAGDPWATFDSFGNLFLTYMSADLGSCDNLLRSVKVVLSADGGSSFALLSTFPSPSGVDKPMIATGPSGSPGSSSVWLVYVDYGSDCTARMTACGARVTGLGASYVQLPFSSATLPMAAYNFLSPTIAVGPSGQVLCAWNSASTSQGLWMVQNLNGLNNPNWINTTSVLLNETSRHQIPAVPPGGNWVRGVANLAWNRSNALHPNRVYLVYNDYADPGAPGINYNIYCKYSDDNGATFQPSAPIKVNDDTTTTDQFMPSVAVDQSNGNVAICWYDCRDDINNVKTRAYCALSRDGGQTFLRNFQIEPGQSNASVLTVNPYFSYGDYTGLDFFNTVLGFAWANNSNVPAGANPDGSGAMDTYFYRNILGY